MDRLTLLLTAALLCLCHPSLAGHTIPACADASGVPGRLRCVNWQTNATGGCTTTYTSSSYIPSFNGVTCIYSPGFVVGHYANNAACTWIIPKKNKCTSLQFLLVVKDLAHNEQNGRNCAINDHLEVDDGQRLYCDRQHRSNCPYNNCPSATYTTDASSLKITFRSDGSDFGRGIFGVVFEIPIANCGRRIKRTAYKDYEELALPHHFEEELPYHCPQDYHPYQNSRTPCECFGNCTAKGVENLRAVVQEIISDSTGKNALKYINSRSDLLRNVARLVRKNINDFNVPITPYELINEASCIEPPQQAFALPDMRTTHHQDTPSIHNPDPWTPPTYKPRQQTTPTHKHYPHTRSTHKPYPWTHSTHEPRPHTTPNQNPYPQTTPTHKPYPWTRSTQKPYTRTAPTHKPYPWTRPTHKSYSRTRSTSRPEQWSRHPTRRTYYRSTRRPIYPQLQHWSRW